MGPDVRRHAAARRPFYNWQTISMQQTEAPPTSRVNQVIYPNLPFAAPQNP